MRFRLVPKSSILDDPELLEARTAKRMKIDPHCQRGKLLRTESTFQRCIDYVDIAGRS